MIFGIASEQLTSSQNYNTLEVFMRRHHASPNLQSWIKMPARPCDNDLRSDPSRRTKRVVEKRMVRCQRYLVASDFTQALAFLHGSHPTVLMMMMMMRPRQVHLRQLRRSRRRQIRAVRGLVPSLVAVVAHYAHRELPAEVRLRVHRGNGERRVRELALRPIRAEAEQVERTEHATTVTVLAVGSVPTEPAVVPRAVADLTLRVDVSKGALLVAARTLTTSA